MATPIPFRFPARARASKGDRLQRPPERGLLPCGVRCRIISSSISLGLTATFASNIRVDFRAESHLNFRREVKEGDWLRFEARLVDFDPKRIHFYMEMLHADEGYIAASYESLSAYVSMTSRRTTAMPDELLDRLVAVKSAHGELPRPWQLGHAISVRPPRKAESLEPGSR